MVQSSHISYDDVLDYRYNKHQKDIENGKYKDFDQNPNQHQKFDYQKTIDEMISEQGKKNSQIDKTASHSNTEFLIGLYISMTLCISGLLVTKAIHKESEKLHELNRIYNNENARVAKSQNKDELVEAIQACKKVFGANNENDIE